MFPGGGGMNDRKMQQMMKQMGIDMTELDAEEVIIRTPDEELVFTGADVQRMDAQGQQTYTIVGEPESRPRGESDESAGTTEADASEESADTGDAEIPDGDIEIVVARTGASEDDARAALEDTNGDLAAAVEQLE
jgi:nascent polypeptide-associated complex subunit alpha